MKKYYIITLLVLTVLIFIPKEAKAANVQEGYTRYYASDYFNVCNDESMYIDIENTSIDYLFKYDTIGWMHQLTGNYYILSRKDYFSAFGTTSKEICISLETYDDFSYLNIDNPDLCVNSISKTTSLGNVSYNTGSFTFSIDIGSYLYIRDKNLTLNYNNGAYIFNNIKHVYDTNEISELTGIVFEDLDDRYDCVYIYDAAEHTYTYYDTYDNYVNNLVVTPTPTLSPTLTPTPTPSPTSTPKPTTTPVPTVSLEKDKSTYKYYKFIYKNAEYEICDFGFKNVYLWFYEAFKSMYVLYTDCPIACINKNTTSNGFDRWDYSIYPIATYRQINCALLYGKCTDYITQEGFIKDDYNDIRYNTKWGLVLKSGLLLGNDVGTNDYLESENLKYPTIRFENGEYIEGYYIGQDPHIAYNYPGTVCSDINEQYSSWSKMTYVYSAASATTTQIPTPIIDETITNIDETNFFYLLIYFLKNVKFTWLKKEISLLNIVYFVVFLSIVVYVIRGITKDE